MINQKLVDKNIISILGIEALPDEQKLSLLDKMSNLSQKRVSLRILELLNKDEQDIFMAAAEKNDEDKVKDILDSKNINVEVIVQEEVAKLKEELNEVVEGLGV